MTADPSPSPAPQEPEVLFCNVCNQSVPEAALRDGRAIRLPSGVGPACVAGSQLAAAAQGSGSLPSGLGKAAALGSVVVVLAGLVSLGLFVSWRLDESARDLDSKLEGLAGRLTRQEERQQALEERLSATLVRSDLTAFGRDMTGRLDASSSGLEDLSKALDRHGARFDGLEKGLGEVQAGQVQQQARAALVQDELRNLAGELAEIRAMPRAAPVRSAPGDVDPGSPIVGGGDPIEPIADPNALPGPLAHQVRRLADADAGTRFEAVEELLSSGDPRVLDPVLPLSSDADPFVRRLVLEGISEFRDRRVVDTLLVALADPEEIVRFTAHASLKRVTNQNLPFDPDASDSERSAMQRRWKKWWDENRDAF